VRKDVEKEILDPRGSQGDEEIFFNIYKVKEEDLYIKVEHYTDSYGNGDMVRGVQFVSPIEKTVQVFEPLK